MNVKEAKEKLAALIAELDKFDDNTEFVLELSDNDGGSYTEHLGEFYVKAGRQEFSGKAHMLNFE